MKKTILVFEVVSLKVFIIHYCFVVEAELVDRCKILMKTKKGTLLHLEHICQHKALRHFRLCIDFFLKTVITFLA